MLKHICALRPVISGAAILASSRYRQLNEPAVSARAILFLCHGSQDVFTKIRLHEC